MAETRWLSDAEQQTWRRFIQMQAELSARMNRDLQRSADLSLADYEVLVNLGDAPGGRLRVHELRERLQWEQSRLSHHLPRMQRRGLLVREDCPSDRRGAFAVLTGVGRQRLSQAAPAHVETVRHLIFDQLNADSLRTLDQISSSVLAAAAHDGVER